MSNRAQRDWEIGPYGAGLCISAIGLLIAVAISFSAARAADPAAFLGAPVALIATAGAGVLTLSGFVLMIAGAASSPPAWDESETLQDAELPADARR